MSSTWGEVIFASVQAGAIGYLFGKVVSLEHRALDHEAAAKKLANAITDCERYDERIKRLEYSPELRSGLYRTEARGTDCDGGVDSRPEITLRT